ncbi:MAG: hypothetical protein EOO46_18945 [Flavobacterium sp.]|nr:MAG: hypothetical protein EOO46_18945 [Flavobacterium sp.]
MFRRLFRRKINDTIGLFNGHFLEAKAFYAMEFDAVSCVSFIGDIDTGKAFELISESLQTDIVATYQHSYFDHNEQKLFFNNTLFVLTNQRMIELGNNWCQLHAQHQYGWAAELVKRLSAYRIVNDEPVIGFARQAATN